MSSDLLGTPPRFVLAGGISAEIAETDGASVALRAPVPSPPGSTLAGLLAGEGRPVRVKVRSCRRLDGEPVLFRIEGRFVDLGREQRAILVSPRPAR